MGPKTRILDATMLVFRRHGLRRSSIEQVAEAAGLTRQALYHHFESKEALFREVAHRAVSEARESMQNLLVHRGSDDRQTLMNLIERVVIDPPEGIIELTGLAEFLECAPSPSLKTVRAERELLLDALLPRLPCRPTSRSGSP